MEQVTTPDGITVSYERYGSGAPLVLVHGSLNDHNSAWMMMRPLLEPHFTVYAVDRRGRGQTTATEGHTIPDEAKDIVAVIESIGEPVYLFGHSYGADVSMVTATLVPDKIRKLVLYEPPLPTAMSHDDLDRLLGILAEGQTDEFIAEFMRLGPKIPEEEIKIVRSTPIWQFLVADASNSAREFPAVRDFDFDPADYSSLPMPVLLLTGSESEQSTYATNALDSAIPQSRVHVFEGQGHVAIALAPQMVADAVMSFVAE